MSKTYFRMMSGDVFSSLSLCDHDLRLPLLGRMRLVLTASDDGGAYLAYVKEADFLPLQSNDSYKTEMPTKPYCHAKVAKPSEWESLVGIDMERKVSRKLEKLKKWLIAQDIQLGRIMSSNRKVVL